MPYEGPGVRKNNAVATKAVLHGDPCIEKGAPGTAFRTLQLGPYVDPAVSAGTQTIQVGEPFVIQIGGITEARAAVIQGGLAAAPEGTKLYIRSADNILDPSSNAGANTKFGVVDSVDAARGIARINTNLRDTF